MGFTVAHGLMSADEQSTGLADTSEEEVVPSFGVAGVEEAAFGSWGAPELS